MPEAAAGRKTVTDFVHDIPRLTRSTYNTRQYDQQLVEAAIVRCPAATVRSQPSTSNIIAAERHRLVDRRLCSPIRLDCPTLRPRLHDVAACQPGSRTTSHVHRRRTYIEVHAWTSCSQWVTYRLWLNTKDQLRSPIFRTEIYTSSSFNTFMSEMHLKQRTSWD